MSLEYKKAGVDLEAGYESVRRIKKLVDRTKVVGMEKNIGDFGGMFDLSLLKIKEPILVSGTDGVGTKLLIAKEMNIHNTIGQDAVAMCVNDILTQGAKPLFFLDYIAIGKTDPTLVEDIVKGVSDGCIMSECALIGGETAEMPGMYDDNEYDIAGFATGVVEKSKIIDGSKVQTDDVLIGLSSSGLHSNGFSLVRKIIADNKNIKLDDNFFGNSFGQTLLKPTRIYVKSVLKLLEEVEVHALCHITGGGFDENIPRILKDSQGVEINESSWPKQEIFGFLEKTGNIKHREMYNIFNMGIGMILVCKKALAPKAIEILESYGEKAFVIGKVTTSKGVNICV